MSSVVSRLGTCHEAPILHPGDECGNGVQLPNGPDASFAESHPAIALCEHVHNLNLRGTDSGTD